MLNDLISAHDELEACLEQLDALAEGPAADRLRLAEARWKLSKASARRFRILDQIVYPGLLPLLSAADARKVRALRDETMSLRTASIHHVTRWTLDKAVADWAGYQAASHAMRAAMRERVNREKQVLYPLIEAHAERPQTHG